MGCVEFLLRVLHAPCIAAAVVLGGCSLEPEYSRPEVPLSETFAEPHSFSEQKTDGPAIANVHWWDVFKDERLQALLKEALDHNRDLALAFSRIDEAQALITFTRANQFPFLNGRGGVSRGDGGEVFPQQSSFAGFGELTFEVDLWGKLRNATDAQRANLLASEYAAATIRISLLSQVADLYFALIDLDARIEISKRTLVNRESVTMLLDTRLSKGIIPEIDLNQAQIEEALVGVNLVALERERAVTEHAMRVLLGRANNAIERSPSLVALGVQLSLPAGVPANVLSNRPDLLALEEGIRAQLFLEGVAQAQRLPSLQILGTLGLTSAETSSFFDSDSKSWSIGGNLFSPFLNYGQNEARVEAQRARVEQARQSYEAGVLNALREVEDALIEISTFYKEYGWREKQLRAAKNASYLSRARYDAGIVTYVEVLDLDRSYYSAELAASQTYRRYLGSVAKLYRTLGGGWERAAAK
jgi:multidrug efflux system outer membrane protein